MKSLLITKYLVLCTLVVMLSSCQSSIITPLPSKNQNSRVKAIVLHFTALDFRNSVNALVDDGGLSAHYLIPQHQDPSYPYDDLKIFQLVEEDDRAWHAGVSQWQQLSGLNDQSIGIELVHQPKCDRQLSAEQKRKEATLSIQCEYPEFESKQISLLIELLTDILKRHPDIHPTAIVGHSDIAPSRKSDPGPKFPWFTLYQAGIGAWYDKDDLPPLNEAFTEQLPHIGVTQAALAAYGYQVIETGVLNQQTRDALAAFQTHFTPHHVSGNNTAHTNAILFALLKKYFSSRYRALMNRFERDSALTQTAKLRLHRGQIEATFPEVSPSDRKWVNNRSVFKGYENRGVMTLTNLSNEVLKPSILINERLVNIPNGLSPKQTKTISIGEHTLNGSNLLKVIANTNRPAMLKVEMPYPVLTDNMHNIYTFTDVDELIQRDVDNGFPGAVLVIVKDGQIVKRSAYGYSLRFKPDGTPLDKPIPMTTDTLFDVASNTKTFATTLAIMHLLDRGKIALDDPIYEYIPEYRGNGRDARRIRDLLSHTSGFAPSIAFYDDKNGLHSQSPERTKRLLLESTSFTHSNGVKTAYSDINFMLLGTLVERITGQALDTYVEQQIYQPLGLRSTVFNPLTKLPARTSYAATELKGNTRDGRVQFSNIRTHTLIGEVHDEKAFYSMAGVSGHAGLFSTADELAVLSQVLLNLGGYGSVHLFSSSTVNQFVQPGLHDPTMGLGFRRAGDGSRRWQFGPYASERAFGHTGWTGTLTVIDPEHDLAIVLLTNMRHSSIIETRNDDDETSIDFSARRYETGRYGSVVSLIYEALAKGTIQLNSKR